MQAEQERPASPPPAEEATKPGVLVVDDDPLLLTLLRSALARQGLEVWTSASGADAVERYRDHRERIGVVLLDVCMPELDGPATLAALRLVNPEVQACFMSGFLGAHSAEALQALGVARLYEKPFHLDKLSAELGELARSA